jgi:hypothetical protein
LHGRSGVACRDSREIFVAFGQSALRCFSRGPFSVPAVACAYVREHPVSGSTGRDARPGLPRPQGCGTAWQEAGTNARQRANSPVSMAVARPQPEDAAMLDGMVQLERRATV